MATPPKKAAKPIPGVENGDHVYIQGQDGPLSVRVVSHGRDGLRGDCDKGVRHSAPWSAVLGHKARLLKDYKVVDQGADGAILEDPAGKRRFLAGEMPPVEAPPETPTHDDDPLAGGLGRLAKALELPPMIRLPNGPILFMMKGGPIAQRPGLSLKDVTDKGGHQTKRWTKTGPDMPEPTDGPAPHKHGDVVQFRHHDTQGEGKIVGSGGDGVTVQDASGREHQVRHEHLLKPGEAAPGASGGGEGQSPGSAPAPAAPGGGAAPLFTPQDVANLPAKAVQPFKDQAELYEKSGEALTELKGWLNQGKGICSKLGYETMGKGMDGVDWSKPGGMLFIAPLKGEKRAAEKVESDYGGDWSQLKDVVRCSIAVDTMDDIKDVVDALKAGGMQLAQQPKDRFVKPLPEGYRDLMLSVTFKNGTIGEVQVHLKKMLEAKEAGHKPYEVMRTIDAKPREQWTAADKKTWQDAFDESSAIYSKAWGEASGDGAAMAPAADDLETARKAGKVLPGKHGLMKVSKTAGDDGKDRMVVKNMRGGFLGNNAVAKKHVKYDQKTGDHSFAADDEKAHAHVAKHLQIHVDRLASAEADAAKGSMSKALGIEAEAEWEFRDREGAKFRRPAGQPGGITDVFNDGKWEPYTGDRTAAYLESDAAEDPEGGGEGGGAPGGGDDDGDMAKSMVLLFKAIIPGGAGGDLLAMPVQVTGHVRGGRYVAPHTAIRHHKIDAPAPAPAPAASSIDHVPPAAIKVIEDSFGAKVHPDGSVTRTDVPPAPPEKKHFYVSAIDGKRKHLVAGPYGSHEEALSRVEEVRKHADERDPRAHFMAWGTAGSSSPIKTPLGEGWRAGPDAHAKSPRRPLPAGARHERG